MNDLHPRALVALFASAGEQLAKCYLPAPLRADATGAADQPKWQMLFPLGTFHNGGWPKEGITIDPAFCDTMVANWKKRGNPALPVDYLHRGAFDELPVDQQIASGWIENLEARTDGLWAQVKWTPKARELIAADEYRFLSPEFHLKGIDAHTGKPQGPTLVGAGLLNRPAFQEMPRVAAAAVTTNPVVPKEKVMTKAQILALLAKLNIAVAADISEDDARAALEKHGDDTSKAAQALKDKDAEALKAKVTTETNEKALKAQIEELTLDKAKLGVRVAQIEKVNFDAGVDALLKRAASEGRITAAAAQKGVRDLADKMGLTAATEFVDTFPKGTVASLVVLGHGLPGEGGEPVDLKALQAKYDAELDAVSKADGQGTQAASKKVNRKPEFAPLFALKSINAKPTADAS